MSAPTKTQVNGVIAASALRNRDRWYVDQRETQVHTPPFVAPVVCDAIRQHLQVLSCATDSIGVETLSATAIRDEAEKAIAGVVEILKALDGGAVTTAQIAAIKLNTGERPDIDDSDYIARAACVR